MAYYRQRLTEQVTDLVKDVAVVGLGFTASGYVGRIVEDKVKSGVTSTSSTSDKILAWGANNAPKAGIYVVSKMLKADILQDIGKAAAGNIAFDSVTRLASQGYNPYNITYRGYRIMDDKATEQKLMQENQLLRNELNKALAVPPPDYARFARQQRYGSMPFPVVNERQRKYGAMEDIVPNLPTTQEALPTSPAVAERQRKFGAMPFPFSPPAIAERQTRYSSMPTNPAILERQRRYGAMPEIAFPNVDKPDFGITAEIPGAIQADRPDFGAMPASPAAYDGPNWGPVSTKTYGYGFASTLDNSTYSSSIFGML